MMNMIKFNDISKNKIGLLSVLLSIPLIISACNSVPKETIANADYGKIPPHYQLLIKNKITDIEDRDKLKYEFSEPRKCYGIRPLVGLFRASFGHCVEVSVRKKSPARQEAATKYLFFIRGEEYLMNVTGNPRVHFID